jgi:hypothetical protein
LFAFKCQKILVFKREIGLFTGVCAMKSWIGSVGLGMCVVLGGVGSAQADEAAMLEGARKVAVEVPSKLLDMLNAEIAKGGVVSTIEVCHDRAPAMARAASEKTGWSVRRVSLRNRNPKAVPDAWEAANLKAFDSRVAAGEEPKAVEAYAVVEQDGRKEFRYMKALGVQGVCSACHGPVESLRPEVAEKLHTLYPQDLATGYDVGQVRGAITLRKPL